MISVMKKHPDWFRSQNFFPSTLQRETKILFCVKDFFAEVLSPRTIESFASETGYIFNFFLRQ